MTVALLPTLRAYQDSWVHDTGSFTPRGTVPNNYTAHDVFARYALNTGELALYVQALAPSGVADFEGNVLTIWVNKVLYQTITVSVFDVQQQYVIPLPVGANKLVEIDEHFVYVTAITTVARPTDASTPAHSLVWVGDSITAGYVASPVSQCYAEQWKHQQTAGFDAVYCLAVAGNTLGGYTTTTFVNALLPCTLGTSSAWGYFELGINDYINAGLTAAAWGTLAGQCIDASRVARPNLKWYLQTLLLSQSDGVANVKGNIPQDFRDALATVQSARSSFCVLIDGKSLCPLVDIANPHPTTTGHQIITSNLLPILAV